MYLEERVPQQLEELKEKYHCDDLDFSEINKNKKYVMSKGGGKKFISERNEQIDLDFIKESNLIENIEDVDVIQTGLKDISEYGHIPYSMKESIKIYKATD